MRNKRLVILAVALLIHPAAAQQESWQQPEDHLEPEGSVLGGSASSLDYDIMLRDLLHDAYDSSVVLRMVGLPPFTPEYAVGLRSLKPFGEGAPYRIFVLTPNAQIWTYHNIAALKSGDVRVVSDTNNAARDKQIAELQSSVPANPRDLKIGHCEIALSEALGNRIASVWRKMLMNTRYAAQFAGGSDGIGLHFSMFVRGRGTLAGELVASRRNSATGTLAALANAMRDVCEKKATGANLENLTSELEQRLQKGEGR
jgi:hypothetical protein